MVQGGHETVILFPIWWILSIINATTFKLVGIVGFVGVFCFCRRAVLLLNLCELVLEVLGFIFWRLVVGLLFIRWPKRVLLLRLVVLFLLFLLLLSLFLRNLILELDPVLPVHLVVQDHRLDQVEFNVGFFHLLDAFVD